MSQVIPGSGKLLFVAHEPSAENEKDGMTQRVKWIDDRFADVPRTILSISWRRNFRRQRIARNETLLVEKINLFLHFWRIIRLAAESQIVYVHSCYNALLVIPLYFIKSTVVTDLHGVVPEEELLMGNLWRSRLMSIVERVVAKRSLALVFVTKAMEEHFSAKYRSNLANVRYVLPIISAASQSQDASGRNQHLVIYAGGLQTWQRVDRMLYVAKCLENKFDFLFLTGDPDALRFQMQEYKLHKARVSSAPAVKVFEYYRGASFGFLLRDDSTINRVACPTKLVEYLWAGLIPIVEQPLVGDFFLLGYKFILVKDFLEERIPSSSDLNQWRKYNIDIARDLGERAKTEFRRLRAMCLRHIAP